MSFRRDGCHDNCHYGCSEIVTSDHLWVTAVVTQQSEEAHIDDIILDQRIVWIDPTNYDLF